MATGMDQQLFRDLSGEQGYIASKYPDLAANQLRLVGTAAKMVGATSWFTTFSELSRTKNLLGTAALAGHNPCLSE
jgi:hypothetical protein